MRRYWLLRLYPRVWRDRYGDELAALLDASPASWRVHVDLLRGAAREWLHELTGPRVLTPGRRLAFRTAERVLVAAALAAAIGAGAGLAPLPAGGVAWPVQVIVIALFLGMIGRAAFVGAGRFSTAASRRGRRIGYPEFAGWIAVAVVVRAVVYADPSPGRLSAVYAVSTFIIWWYWIEALYAATPRAARLAEVERRLMSRPGIIAASIARFDQRRAANAERLMRFYGRIPALPSPFVSSGAEGPRRPSRGEPLSIHDCAADLAGSLTGRPRAATNRRRRFRRR